MKNSEVSPPYPSRRSCKVSIVYVGPGRSMSTRLTENCGLERRDDRHQIAILRSTDWRVGLLPGAPGRDEHDLIEGEPARNLARGHQVAVVHRIEVPPMTPTRRETFTTGEGIGANDRGDARCRCVPSALRG